MTLQLVWVQIFIKNHEINIYRVQYQFYRHQHGDQVPACKKSIYANEKYQRAYNQKVGDGNALYHCCQL